MGKEGGMRRGGGVEWDGDGDGNGTVGGVECE